MEANRNYINENIVNISLMAGKLMADGKISVEDHAELTDHIVAMAESFEVSHKDIDYNAQVKAGEPAPDYVEDIDAFAEKALTEAYPPKDRVSMSFAETNLGKFCLEEAAYRLREIHGLDPDTLGSEFVSALAEKLFDVCLDNDSIDYCVSDFLTESGIEPNTKYREEQQADGFADTNLGRFCLDEVSYRLRENFDIDPDTIDSGLRAELAENLSEVCLDYDAMDSCIEDFLQEHHISVDQERSSEALSEEEALSDIRAYLERQDDQYFTDRCTTKEEVLADTELLGKLAGRHHCTVNMFDGDRESSCVYACNYEPGIHMDEVYLMSGSVKKEFFRGTPAECDKFCEEHNWSFVDENGFEWGLALKSDVGPIKPTLADQIQNAASQAGKGSQGSTPSLVQMPGTQAPDWGKKQWGNDR